MSVLTTRLVGLYLLGIEIGTATAALTAREAGAMGAAVADLPNAAAQFLEEEDVNVSQIANALKDQRALLLAGGGANWFSAAEGALKIEEESGLLCKAYRPAEYAHNAISLLSEDIGTVVVAPSGRSYARLHDVTRTARAAGSPCLALVIDDGDDTVAPDAMFVIAVPATVGELLTAAAGRHRVPVAGLLPGRRAGGQPGHPAYRRHRPCPRLAHRVPVRVALGLPKGLLESFVGAGSPNRRPRHPPAVRRTGPPPRGGGNRCPPSRVLSPR